jgi:Fic family protein
MLFHFGGILWKTELEVSYLTYQGNYEQWIEFFLDAVHQSSIESIRTIKEMLKIQKKNEELISIKLGRSKATVLKLFNYINEHPIIEIKKTSLDLNLSFNTVSNAIEELKKLNILKQVSNNSRNRVFIYFEFLNILKRDTE